MSFYILWPEKRSITASQIRGWYLDAVDNKQVKQLPPNATAADMAQVLHQAGLITLRAIP